MTAQRRRDPRRFGLMRRIQMVQAVVTLCDEIREERGKPIAHGDPVGVAETPMAEIDGRGVSAIGTRIDAMLLSAPVTWLLLTVFIKS